MKTAEFRVDSSRCTGCAKCLAVCPGNMVGGDVLQMENGIPVMKDQSRFGWRGCWRCQHCMAVCPEGAISVLRVSADNAPAKPDADIAQKMPELVQYRRTCRSFRREEVDPQIIDLLIQAVSAVPTGGNSYGLEFSVIESRQAMHHLCDLLYPSRQMNLFESNDDMSSLGIYNAPHLFIAHKTVGQRFTDGDLTELGIATAYFELLADARGLGTVITNHVVEEILKNRDARRFLEIPDDHTALAAVGFGYPVIRYARGVIKHKKVHRIR